jgi:hypothetical protein
MCTNIITQNVLPHGNIKIYFCIFTRFFLTQSDGKRNCLELLWTYANHFSKTVSFDGHLHCCPPPTQAHSQTPGRLLT